MSVVMREGYRIFNKEELEKIDEAILQARSLIKAATSNREVRDLTVDYGVETALRVLTFVSQDIVRIQGLRRDPINA